MPEVFGEKTHPATPHRREQARRQGQYPRSQDLASVSVLLASLVALYMLGHELVDQILLLFSLHLRSSSLEPLHATHAVAQAKGVIATCLHLLAPLLGIIFLAAFLTHWSQGGYTVLPQRLVPQLRHLHPGEAFRRILSLTNAVRMLMGLLKLGVVAGVVFLLVHQRGEQILACHQYPPPRLARFLAELFFWSALQVTAGFAALALLDYGYQYWKCEQDLRMTDQELREELRTLQADPQLQARRRALQRDSRLQQGTHSGGGINDGSTTSS
jgi:flagellar biosynthesis protein FlhB